MHIIPDPHKRRPYPSKDPRASRGQAAATFEAYLTVESDECILWPWARNRGGYGEFTRTSADGTRTGHLVHIEACIARNGPPPSSDRRKKAVVAHGCGVAHCMNYRHLRWATAKENAEDGRHHGRRVGSEGISRPTVLTGEQVRAMRSEYVPRKVTARMLAEKYGTSVRYAQGILSGNKRPFDL